MTVTALAASVSAMPKPTFTVVQESLTGVRVPFPVRSVQGVRQGRIPFQAGRDGLHFTLPLGGAEVVLVRP